MKPQEIDPKLLENLRPAALLRSVESLGRAEFADSIEAPLMLVRIDDGYQEEVAQALETVLSSQTMPVVTGLAFRTVASMAPRAARGLRGAALSASPPAAQVRAWLKEQAHIAVPMRKRAASGSAFMDRISAGRALNNDVVLRHESVSKFHAWLEVDEERHVYAYDAGSRNGTFVSGVRLAARSGALVPATAELRFARITARMCRAEDLWDALHGDATPQ